MKQIVVASDSHGNHEALMRLVNIYPNALAYLHAGDSEERSEDIFPFITVKGNCDYFLDEPYFKVFNFEGHNIFITHGHKVDLSKDSIVAKAHKYNCDIFIYGHTHRPYYECYRGIHIINPGSLSYARTTMGETYILIKFKEDSTISVDFVQS